jgi:hypothetical protein
LVLRAVCGALNGDALIALDAGAPLRSGNFRGALAYIDNRLAVGVDLDAITAFAQFWTNGHVGCVNLNIRFVIFEDFVIRQALPNLKLHLGARHRYDIGSGLIG